MGKGISRVVFSFLILCALSLCISAFSREIEYEDVEKDVVVPQNEKKLLLEGDHYCIKSKKARKKKYCGEVISTTAETATVRLILQKRVIRSRKIPPRPSRKIASRQEQMQRVDEPVVYRKDTFQASVGALAGFDYFLPALFFQVVVSKNLALGASVVYLNNFQTPRMTATGGYLTASYFFSQSFSGFSVQGALGSLSLHRENGSEVDDAYPLSLLSSLQWRTVSRSGIEFGAGLGIQYAVNNKDNRIVYKGMLPLFMLELGLCF